MNKQVTPGFRAILIILTLSSALPLWSCAPRRSQVSRAATLDNFTRAEGAVINTNTCGTEMKLGREAERQVVAAADRIRSYDAALKAHVVQALRSVPENMLLVLNRLGTGFEVTPNIGSACEKAPLTPAERLFAGEAAASPQACWRQAESGVPPVIFLKGEPAAIRHSLIRVAAYVYSDFLVRRLHILKVKAAGKAGAPALWAHLADFDAARTRLEKSFMDDVAVQRPEVLGRLQKSSKEATREFSSFVFAEAVDSYYCSDETRNLFGTMFPETYMTFVDADDPHSMLNQLGPARF